MYKFQQATETTIAINTSYEGEPIEAKIKRMVSNKEPITDSAPLIYTDRKEGVLPDYDIRTDKMEHAIDAMDKVTKSQLAKRAERHKSQEKGKEEEPKKTEQKNPEKGVETPKTKG